MKKLLLSLFIGLVLVISFTEKAQSANLRFLVSMAEHAYGKVKRTRSISRYIVIVDYTNPSSSKRLYVEDVCSHRIIFETYVAHGKGSGKGAYATYFSNDDATHASSIGVSITGEAYYGDHGLSRRLIGLDYGYNTNMYDRVVVIHGAKYIGNGQIGHSWGCLAVPQSVSAYLVNLVGEDTVVYAYYPDHNWLKHSYFNN